MRQSEFARSESNGDVPDHFTINEDSQKKTEYRYQVFEWVLISVNLLMVTIYTITYWLLVVKGETYVRLENYTLWTHFGVSFMSFVSVCFLADALRRIYQTFKQARNLLPNEKVMLLHFVFFCAYLASLAYRTITIAQYYRKPDTIGRT
jgi:hypothetical protein